MNDDKNEYDFSVEIGTIKFEHPILPGAGYCKDEEHLNKLALSAASAVMLGSVTKEPRTGNEGNVYHNEREFSINSLGMPNRGVDYYLDNLGKILTLTKLRCKPVIVNVAGFSPDEYQELAAAMSHRFITMIELNFGCPNIWGENNEQKQIVSFNPRMIDDILQSLYITASDLGMCHPYLVKLSPYSDPGLLKVVAEVISNYQIVAAVTTCNTFPNGFAFNEKGKPALTMELGGVSGPAMLPIGLGQVMQFRKHLPDHIQIIGVGGINSGADVKKYLDVGATAVQVTTALVNEGPDVFGRLLTEYTDVLGETE